MDDDDGDGDDDEDGDGGDHDPGDDDDHGAYGCSMAAAVVVSFLGLYCVQLRRSCFAGSWRGWSWRAATTQASVLFKLIC